MNGLRWILAFLRDPPGALVGSIATIRLRLAPLESRLRLTATEALRKAARQLALGVVAAAFALVGVGYVLIGLWLGLESLLGPTAASFVLGALFLGFSAVPLVLLYSMLREPASTDEPR
jgi:hypothetical protein